MSKFKIWIVTSEFPPMYGGGISTYCNDAGLAWASCGHEVKIFTIQNIGEITVSRKKLAARLQVIRVPIQAEIKIEQCLGYVHLVAYSLAEEIINTIRSTGITPDFIEVQDYNALGYFLLKKKLLLAPELKNTKIIVFAHTPLFETFIANQAPSYLLPDYWIGQCEKFCLQGADAVVSPSDFLKKRLAQYVREEIEVIPSPFIGYTEKQVKELSVIRPEYDCVYVGRIESRKGVLPLLAAFKKIWKDKPNLRLRMVGGDTFFAPKNMSLKNWIEKEYSAYIEAGVLTLSESVAPDKIPEVFCSGKIVIIPSIYENFPYVCMQAMSLAKVLMVSSAGGQAEMIGDDGTCGSIFCWDEKDSFQKELSALLSKSPAELALIGQNARRKIHKLCAAEKFVERRIAHFKKISAVPVPQNNKYPFLTKSCTSYSIVSINQQNENKEVKGRLSIIIPFYNLGQYLPETLSSIKDSNYSDKEIVIINDGSTDTNSLEILEKIKSNDSSITIINIENAGLSNARNIGAKVATGEFIAFLDADDCVQPEYYKKCIQILETYSNVSFVYSWVKYFEEADGVWINFDTELPYMLAANMLAPLQVVRRRDFLEFGINDKEMIFGMEDYEAWLRMVGHGKLGVSIPELLVRYRVRNNSMSRQFNPSSISYMYEQIATKNNKLYREYGDELFMLVNTNGSGIGWTNPTNRPFYVQNQMVSIASYALSESPTEQFSHNQIIRLKKIAASPVCKILIKFLLFFKIDEFFKFSNKN